MTDRNPDQTMVNRRALNRKLEATGWGLFFIWMGIALFGNIGWGAGLLGVGIITLGAQAARKYFDLKLEGFWLAVGFLFVVGGICKLFNVHLGLVPILCIVAGIALLVSIFVGRARNSELPDRCQWGDSETTGINLRTANHIGSVKRRM